MVGDMGIKTKGWQAIGLGVFLLLLLSGCSQASIPRIDLSNAGTEAKTAEEASPLDGSTIRMAVAAGASGYALKRASGQELLGAIQAVARGDVYLHPAMTRLLVEESWGPREQAAVAVQSLSEREAQVLRLIALGYTTQQVAGQLFLSVRTVETYKVRTMEKLGLSGRAALVRYALEHGFLEAEPDR